MSKSFNVDLTSFNNTSDMDSIYAGNTPVETTPAVVETKKTSKPKTTKPVKFERNPGVPRNKKTK